MKKNLLIILLFLLVGNIGFAQLPFQESFENDATNYDANLFNDFDDEPATIQNDHFSIINSASPPDGWPPFGPFRGFDGTHYLGGEDTQNTTNPLGPTEFAYVVIKKLNISAYESIQLKVLLAAVSGTTAGEEESFERSDFDGLDIQYAFDADAATAGDGNVNTGTYTTIGSFRGNHVTDGWSSDLFEDTDFNDFGDGVGLTEEFQEFTYEIDNSGGSATEISIRFIFRATAGSEEIAVDNIRISGLSGAMPEMNIKGLGNTIIDNDNSPTSSDDTDFGTFEKSSGSNTNTFTIENTGDATLNLTASSPYVTISGDDADFTLVQTPSNSIASAGSSNFQVKFDPVTTGQRIAEISIANDDSNENPYNFKVQGSATSSIVRTPTQRELDNFTTGISGALASTRLDDDKVIIIYRNGSSTTTDYLKAVIGTVSGTDISYGSAVNIENGIYSGTSIVALSTTKAVVFYHHNEDPEDRLRYNVLDISGDNITAYASELVGTGIWRSGSNTMSAIALKGDQLVIAYHAEEGTDDNLYVQTGIVNAQDITWGTKVAVTTNIRNIDITRLSDSQFALVYSQIDGDGKIVSGNVSGNSISLGSSQTFENSTITNKVALEALSSSQLVIAYEDEGSSNPDDPGYIMYATISGTTFSFLGAKTRFYYGGDGIDDLDLGMLSSTEVFLAVDGGGGDPSVYYVGELSSDNIDLSTETTFVVDQADDISVACLTPNLVVLNYTDDENNSGAGDDNGASRVLTFGTVSMPEIDISGNSTSIGDGDSSPSLADSTDFGEQSVRVGTITRTFTIENTGNDTLNLTDSSPFVTITGTDASDFSLTQIPSDTILASGASTFQITFNPSTAGERNAIISIDNDDNDENPYNFNIRGTGLVPEIDIKGNSVTIVDDDTSPATADHTDFGGQTVSSGTIIKTFTIDNIGGDTLNLTGSLPFVSIAGDDAGDFSLTQTPSDTILALGSSTFQITFNPSAVGLRTATISIANDDSDENPYNFNIQGTGCVAPTVTTQDATSIGTTTATGNGNVSDLGVPNPTQHGVVWSNSADPTTRDSKTEEGAKAVAGPFTTSITGLVPNTLYHYRAYATNSAGTTYGSDKTLTTHQIMINEVDADTPGTDVLEFVELYDGGIGNVSLNGLVLVFYNGSFDYSYNIGGHTNAIDLDGYTTDANGYFVIGNSAVSGVDIVFITNNLQNGPDAVAIYVGDGTDFPYSTAVTTTNLIDAVVYDTNDADDAGLLILLNASEPQINEDDNGGQDKHSNQRIPNGTGGLRNTTTYTQQPPTPAAANYAYPEITSVAYNYNTNTLVTTGKYLVDNAGANNDVDISLLKFTGEGGASYTLTSTSDVEIGSSTQFTITLSGMDLPNVEALLNEDGATANNGSTYYLSAADNWLTGAPGGNVITDNSNPINVTNYAVPSISSVAYDASSDELAVLGDNFVTYTGGNNDISASLLTFKGVGNATYTLSNTSNIEITSASAFTLTLDAADKTTVNGLLNKDGISSSDSKTYNLSLADNWMQGSPTGNNVEILTNGITVSNVEVPSITSSAYNYDLNQLTVTGTDFVSYNGASNDVDITKFTIKGENAVTYVLSSSADVEITSATSFVIQLSGDDIFKVETILNEDGANSASSGTLYNLDAAEDWLRGIDPTAVIADVLIGLTVSNYAVPQISTAAYDWNTGNLTISGDNFVQISGGTNDISASLITIFGENSTSYTLTNSADVEITSSISALVALSATDKLNVHGLLNRNGTESSYSVTYNISAADNWMQGTPTGNNCQDLAGNAITVTNIKMPTVTSAVYVSDSGELVVTGTNFFKKDGSLNDVDVSMITVTGEGGDHTISATPSDVEIDSETQFTATFTGADKTNVDSKLDQVGTTSSGSITYNLKMADNWLAAADAVTDIADLASNAITVYDEFTSGAIETTGETICYNDDPAEIGTSTVASGGDETITYKWESSLDAFATAGTQITGATASSYNPPTGLQATTSYRRYAKDGTSNTTFEQSTGTWVVTVNNLPVAKCQDIKVYLDAFGSASIDSSDINDGSAYECGLKTMTLDKSDFSCADVGANTVTLTVSDVNGNSASEAATVTVLDNIAPTANCKNKTLSLDADGEVTVSVRHINNGSWDACGIQSMSVKPNSFSETDIGVNTVVLTVTDNNGNVSSCKGTVTVVDNTPPTVFCNTADYVITSNGQYELTQADIDALAKGTYDNVSDYENLIISVSPVVLTCSEVGGAILRVYASDEAGNLDSCAVQVGVSPMTVLLGLDSIADVTTDEDIPLSVSFSANTGSNACSAQSVIVSASNDNLGLINSLTVNYSPSDTSGMLDIDLVPNESGMATITVDVEDRSNGDKVSVSFMLTVNPVNDPPVVVQEVSDMEVKVNETFALEISKILGVNFDDVDDPTLVYNVRFDDDVLPDWITTTDDVNSLFLSFEPLLADTGCYNIVVDAEDVAGAVASDTFEFCVNKILVGIDDLGQGKFEISMYPNPTEGMVNVKTNTNTATEIGVVVINIAGAEVFRKKYRSGDLIRFDLSEEVSGMYLVFIEIDNQQVIKKLILDRR